MSSLKWVFEDRDISDLIFADYNPRKMTIVQREQLEDSLRKFGVVEPVVINADNKVIGGHQRLNALKKQGVLKVKASVPNRQLSDDEEKELNLRLNKNIGEWDIDALTSNFDIDMLEDVGFLPDELTTAFADDVSDATDDIPVDASSIVAKGDIYSLGDHRLICGDATIAEDITRLIENDDIGMVFTDPPYDFKADFLTGVFNVCDKHIFVMDGDKNHVRNIAKHLDLFNVFYVIKFNVPTWNLSKLIPLTTHLLVAHFHGKGAINRPLTGLHSTIEVVTKNDRKEKSYKAKNIDTIMPFIDNFSDRGDTVLDLFGGSGTTLVVCEQLRRKCRMIEYEPAFCDIIIKRWENMTGKKAVKLS